MPLKSLPYREVERKLLKAGFVIVSIRGSHVKFAHLTSEGTRIAMVPRKNRDIPIGTLTSICKQAGFTKDEFDAL